MSPLPTRTKPRPPYAGLALAALAVAYPLLGPLDARLSAALGMPLGQQLAYIYIYMILAAGLNVIVGYTGLLHLGIAAFFGIGAYITGILTAPAYPFQIGFLAAVVASTAGAALLGLLLGAPTLRLRGDYLAIVTLGFGEVVRYSLRNLDEITAGTRGLNPVPSAMLPAPAMRWWQANGWGLDFSSDYRLFYFLSLGVLLVVVVLLRNLERSRLGRAWVAIREDELAATCMGLNAARVKLSAFALGCGLAGLAGCLYAMALRSTAGPDAFDFNRSVIMLCCVILGGLGSLRGALLGAFLLMSFDTIVSPMIDARLQDSTWLKQIAADSPRAGDLLTFSNWKLMIFGVALILTMRLRPEGLLPAVRVQQEFHPDQPGKTNHTKSTK